MPEENDPLKKDNKEHKKEKGNEKITRIKPAKKTKVKNKKKTTTRRRRKKKKKKRPPGEDIKGNNENKEKRIKFTTYNQCWI